MREHGSGTRIAMERFFADQGLAPSSSIEMTSNEAIKQSVQAGLGLGIVSVHTVELELEVNRLVILNVESFPIMRRWYLVHRKGKRLSAAATAFKEFVLDYRKK
jgi:DNA-binding transcriptional LysR family regulator